MYFYIKIRHLLNIKMEYKTITFYSDVTLYAKIRETRFFNYKTGNWEYTK